MIPLFEQYPILQKKIPYISLGQFPTSIQLLGTLSKELGVRLYIKRDDLSGKIYGGNKLRKLEFILADVLNLKSRAVITYGGAGSNHALATAIYARQLGLECISILALQPNAHHVRENLLLSHHFGASLHLCSAYPHQRKINKMMSEATEYYKKLLSGHSPYVIPFGGSSPLGSVGFVNAAFELKDQINNNLMEEPDFIYLACGSVGTAAGLMLGCKAANIKSQIVPVLVIEDNQTDHQLMELLQQTNSILYSLDESFPEVEIRKKDICIRKDFFGKQYALFTEKGMEAVDLIKEKEGIELEGTYTGKAFSAVIHDTKSQAISGKVVLFWNTINSNDFSDIIATKDYQDLPRSFHRFFTQKVQPLDRKTMKK